MTGDIIVNGTDIYTQYGAYATEGGLNSLFNWPSPKEIDTEDYQEENGIRADLSSIKLSGRECPVNLAFKVSDSDTVLDFYSFLSTRPYLTWNFASIGYQRSMRLIGMTGITQSYLSPQAVVRLGDDTPLNGYSYQSPTGSPLATDLNYKLDNVPLSNYGVRVLDGVGNELLTPGNVKGLLKRDISTLDGYLYDNGYVSASGTYIGDKVNNRKLNLPCLMVATSVNGLWRNYRALLYDIIREKNTASVIDRCKRTLYANGQSINCFYSGQSVSDTYFSQSTGYCAIFFTLSLETLA